jgi:hypothetical protein
MVAILAFSMISRSPIGFIDTILLAVVFVATYLALALLQQVLLIVDVEVGKFVEVLLVQNLCEFNRK